MAMLFDSHAHYFDARFTSDECPGGVERLLDMLSATGDLCGIINVGTDISTSRAAVAQAKNIPMMYAAVGIHPSDAQNYPNMDAEFAKLEEMLQCRWGQKIVALGEIGLDYHYPETDTLVVSHFKGLCT